MTDRASHQTTECPLAAGKSPKYRIRALKRRIETGAAQARHYAHFTEVYANAVLRDRAEMEQLQKEIAND